MTTPPKSLEERVRQRREGDDHFDINDCCDEVRQELQALLEFAELQLYNNECNMEGCDAVEFIKWEQCAVLAHAFVQEIKERMK